MGRALRAALGCALAWVVPAFLFVRLGASLGLTIAVFLLFSAPWLAYLAFEGYKKD